MAGLRQQRTPSKAAHRRERQAREHLVQERVTLISIGVLLAVAVIVGAGVLLTTVLPPRSQVLTVGDQRYTARQIAQRAEFAVQGGDQASAIDPVGTTVANLTREEVLLQAGGPLAGDISTDDMKQAIRKRLALAADASDTDYVNAYQAFLRETPIPQELYERSIRAQVIEERLTTKFSADLPTAGAQLNLQGAAGSDRAKLQALRDAVAGGADFGAKAVELGIVPSATTVEIGWILPESLGEVKDPILALQPGQTTDIIARGTSFTVYRLAERAEQRDYEEAHKTRLASLKVSDWVKQEREKLEVREDVGGRERSWITGRVQDAAREAARRQQAAQPAAPTGR